MGLVLPIIILGVVAAALTLLVVKAFVEPKRYSALAKLLDEGKSRQVVRGAKRLIKKDPRNADAHYVLGRAYAAEGEEKLALVELKVVNQLGSYSPAVDETAFRTLIARLYRKFGQPEEALKEYLLLTKAEPENAEHLFSVGELFEERNNSGHARTYYERAVRLDPQHHAAQVRLGVLTYRAGNMREAQPALQAALARVPADPLANFYLGRIKKQNRDYAGAIPHFERAQADERFVIKARIERGSCQMQNGDFEGAIVELSRAVQQAPNRRAQEILHARYFLAACYEKTRNMDEALTQWEAVYTVQPAFRDVADKLSKYQELRLSDELKDYVTATREQFVDLCRVATESLGYEIWELEQVANGCELVVGESQSKFRDTRKLTRLIMYLRVAEPIDESTVRVLYDEMKKHSAQRGMLFTSSTFSSRAQEFAETRPIGLHDKEDLRRVLTKAGRGKQRTAV